MLPLFVIAAILTGALVGTLFDLGLDDDETEDQLNEIDNSGGFELLDTDAIADLDAQVMSQIETGTEIIDDDSIRDSQNYAATGSVEIQGTENDDTIDANVDVEVAFGEGGNDVILGADHDQVIFGGTGDDVIFGESGNDQLFGDEGDDTVIGSDGDDLIVGVAGTDVIFGGAGDDNIYVYTDNEPDGVSTSFDVVNAGDGDDSVILSHGAALIELGEGADDVLVYGEYDSVGGNPIAVITDFDAAEDQIVLGVYAEGFTFAEGETNLEIGYVLSEIETIQGMATLVVPAVDDEALAADLEGASIGHAVMIGVTPDQIEEGNIRVIVANEYNSAQQEGSVQSVFYTENGATAI